MSNDSDVPFLVNTKRGLVCSPIKAGFIDGSFSASDFVVCLFELICDGVAPGGRECGTGCLGLVQRWHSVLLAHGWEVASPAKLWRYWEVIPMIAQKEMLCQQF